MVLVPPPPPRYGEVESPWERTKRKFMEEPMIPLGAFFTIASMGMAFRERLRFDSSKFNYWLRWRIMFQYGTIAMAVYYTWSRFYKSKNKKPIVQDAFWKEKENSLDKSTIAALSTPGGGITSQLESNPIQSIAERTDSKDANGSGVISWIYSWFNNNSQPKPLSSANQVKERLKGSES